jgi:hypothetical protein
MNIFPNKSKGEPHIFGWKFVFEWYGFCVSHTTPIHETLIKDKASLLNVVKNFKFGSKIALTSISLSFITHLPLNKQTQVQLHSLKYHHLPSPYT